MAEVDAYRVTTQAELEALYRATNFSRSESIGWDKILAGEDDDEENPLGHYVGVPQGSFLEPTLIFMGDSYERGGHDAFFIEELLRLYKAGRLTLKE